MYEANLLLKKKGGAQAGVNTISLLHFDGTSGTPTITDEANSSRLWTATGSTVISNEQTKFGGNALKLTGDGRIWANHEALFNLGSTFTIEWWQYLPSITQTGVFIAKGSSAVTPHPSITMQNGRTQLWGDDNTFNSFFFNPSTIFKVNTWQHYCWHVYPVGNGSTWTYQAYVDGVSRYNASANQVTWGSNGNNNPLSIGGWTDGVSFLTGYLQEFRISKVNRYLGSPFTPPTSRFILD